MGVPALFRWLSKKYPKIISPVQETLPQVVENEDGTTTSLPVDTTEPNPNGEEFDNLYLDMNGIVHPCSHPEDRPAPANEQEMMIAIFEYTDRVLRMVRPRKLLMIAVDGVAPRAKMNQQRSRRFRSAQEAAEKDAQAAEFHAQMLAKGAVGEAEDGNEATVPKKTWDSNSITPGTPFMDLLAASLRYWISYKLSTDPAWEKLKVIISDATVPGEGEHKIMNFVRSQRSSPDHDPNTSHVIYGLDADLIMLGIATHEPKFRVLREDVFANDTKPGHCRKCNQPGHMASQCQGLIKPKPEDETAERPLKPFIWLHVGILREYLAVEMFVPNQEQFNVKFDLERALDDWVFMCFFVGNDFLPHLPSLDIREDGIDTLIAIWRDNLPVMGGYVTKDGHVELARAQAILEGLAKQEDAIFQRRRENDLRQEAKNKRRAEMDRRESNKRQRMSGANEFPASEDIGPKRGPRGGKLKGEQAPDLSALQLFAPGVAQTMNDPRYAKQITHADVVGGKDVDKANQDNRSAAAVLKERLMNSKKPTDNQKAELDALFASGAKPTNENEPTSALGKRTRDVADEAMEDANTDPSTPGRNTPNKEVADPMNRGTSGALGGNSDNTEAAMPEDTVKLWENGYQDRYYEQKFHVGPDDVEFRHKVARDYVEGLCWVLLYYFQGCPSWTWYYPHHYAPFAADFKDMAKQEVHFEKGKPFRPYEQLMGVMPAASNHTLPAVFHPLMTEEDSPIIDFYPTDFQVDLNGKKFAWQGIALLPFIDPQRLLEAMGTKYPLLTEDEHRRNAPGNEALIFSTKHPLYNDIAAHFYGKKAETSKLMINTQKSEGLSGKLLKNELYTPNSDLNFPFANDDAQSPYTSLEANESMNVHYLMPESSKIHKSMLLPGVEFGTPVLDGNDIAMTKGRAERSGRSFGGVQLSQNGDRSDGRRINYAARDSYGNHNGHQSHHHHHNNNGNYRGGHAQSNNYPRNSHSSNNNDPYASQAAAVFANLPPHLAAQAAQHGFAPPPPTGGAGGGFSQDYPQAPPYASRQGAPPPRQQYGGYGSQGYGSGSGGQGYGSHGYGGGAPRGGRGGAGQQYRGNYNGGYHANGNQRRY